VLDGCQGRFAIREFSKARSASGPEIRKAGSKNLQEMFFH